MYKRILTIQDISCVGQCSLTVALPILSACGLETAILPSAVLSTHTAGFKGYTFRDLTDDMPAIGEHWRREGILFDAVYTGYLGSTRQVSIVRDIAHDLGREEAPLVVDPAMADGGRLYPSFDGTFVEAMGTLASEADILLPNITEACFLTGTDYREVYDEAYVRGLVGCLLESGAGIVVLTGVGYDPLTTGVVVADARSFKYYGHRRIAQGCHGTGDVYASAFVGAYLRGWSPYDAAVVAADYTVRCIERTRGDAGHWYGVEFEPLLPDLMRAVGA